MNQLDKSVKKFIDDSKVAEKLVGIIYIDTNLPILTPEKLNEKIGVVKYLLLETISSAVEMGKSIRDIELLKEAE